MLELAKTYDNCPSGKPVLTVVFIHGIADAWARFEKPLGYLTELKKLANVRFVAFDLLGSGKSLKSDELNYDLKEQTEALYNSIKKLDLKTPLVLVGHSMGCLISATLASKHKDLVKELILVSPPIYTLKDFDSPKFAAGQEGFKQVIFLKYPALKNDKVFENELKLIVSNKNNYKTLAGLNIPTTIIYGIADKIIAAYNIPGLIKENPNITAIKTASAHGVSQDKYIEIGEILERVLDETI